MASSVQQAGRALAGLPPGAAQPGSPRLSPASRGARGPAPISAVESSGQVSAGEGLPALLRRRAAAEAAGASGKWTRQRPLAGSLAVGVRWSGPRAPRQTSATAALRLSWRQSTLAYFPASLLLPHPSLSSARNPYLPVQTERRGRNISGCGWPDPTQRNWNESSSL